MMWNRLSNWLKPPVFAHDDEKTHTAGLVHSILFAILGVSALYLLLSPVVAPLRLLWMTSPLILLLAGLFMLLRRGYVRLTGLVLVWGLWCILVYSSYMNGGVRAPGYGGLIVVVMLSAFLVSARFGMVMAGLSIAAGTMLIVLEARGWLPVSDAPTISLVMLVTQVTYFIVAAVLLVLVTRGIRQALGRASSSEERYRLIASIMSDYAFSNRYGPHGEIVDQWLGGAFEVITGYSPQEYFAQGGWLSILHPDDWEQDARDMALIHANQQAVTEVRIRRKDGEVRWVRVYGHPLWDAEENRLSGIYGAVQDITARKHMEFDLRRRADEMTLLYQISLALTSGQDLYHALRAFVKELKRVMTVDAFHIGLYDPQTDLFSYTLFLNLDQDLQLPPRKLSEGPGLTWEVISTRRTLYLPDLKDPETRHAHQILIIVDADVRSYVGIPLIVREQVIGVMSVQAQQAKAYPPDQLRMLETLAAQVAITIEKANLFEQAQLELEERKRVEAELRQREAILETVTFAAEQFLKTSDWRLNINFVLERLGKVLDVTHAYIFEHFVGADGMEYSSLTYEWTAQGYTSDFDVPYYQTPHPVRSDESDADRVLRQGQLYLRSLSSMSKEEYTRLQGLGIKTILEAPLFVGGQWWGTFGLDDFIRERTWTNVELDALKLAAGILSAAIQRQETESAVRESERIYRQAIESAGAVPYYRDYREERYAFMGAEIERIIGYKPEEVTMQLWGKIMLENIPLGEGEGLHIDDAVLQARTGKLKVWKSDMRVLARNGEERWITDSAVELFDDNELSYASVGILQDVTDRKRIEANLRKRESVLEAIIFAAEQFLKSSNWREKINTVLERLGSELNASHAYLFERHGAADGKLLTSMTYEWTAPDCRTDLDNPDFQNLPMQPMGFERFYVILDSGEPLVASSSFFDEIEKQYMQSINIKAFLEMRVLVNGRHWGTIGFDDVLRPREWTPLEVDVLRVAANVLGAAIQRQEAEMALQVELDERKKLIEELKARNAESETLRETTVIVTSTLDVSEAVQRILEQLKRVVPYDSASVWLYEGRLAYMIGQDGLPEAVDRNEQYVVDETEPDYAFWSENAPYILLEDIHLDHPQFRVPPIDYIRGWLSIALRARGKLFGFISLDGRQVGQFSKRDAEIALTYANQVSIALENARLFSGLQNELDERRKLIEELKLKNAESETLRESVAIVASTLEQTEAIDRILKQLERVVHYNSASVQLVSGNMLEIVSARGLNVEEGHIGSQFPLDENEPAYPVVQGLQPYVLFEDVQPAVPAFRDAPHNVIRAWLAVPLKVKGDIIGIIALDGHRVGQFSERDANLTATYANQVAIALENARLFSGLQNELVERQKLIEELKIRNAESETLRESVAIVASTLEQTEAIDRILDQLARVVPYDSASVQLLQGEALEIVRVRGYDDPDSHVGLRFEIHKQEPSYPVLRENAPYVMFEDVQVSTSIFEDAPHSKIHSWLAIPLKVKGRVIGIIALDGYQVAQFSEQDARLAVTYANQVAIALENARLFSELQEELSERQKLIGELENKNSELERFTYTVSHDLKSPLVTINGFLGYLEQDALSGNEARFKRDLQRISEAVRKMQNLLNELLELSRIGRVVNVSQSVPFDELAREAINLVSGRLEARGVVVELKPGLTSVFVDRPRLVEVLQNLLDNAAKYMGDQPQPRIEIGQRADENGFSVFHVQDNGIGIAPEFHERVFGLFNKLDPRSEGTGVGLALVRRIIEIHGGRIWVESSLGSGTTFCFSLPKGNLTQ